MIATEVMQKKQVTSMKIFYFEKHRNNGICDQQYAIYNKLLFFKDYVSLKQLWGWVPG